MLIAQVFQVFAQEIRQLFTPQGVPAAQIANERPQRGGGHALPFFGQAIGQRFWQRWQVALTTFKGLLTTFDRLLAIFQRQLALFRVRVWPLTGVIQCVVRPVPGPLFLQETPVAQTAQHVAGLQRVQTRKVPTRRVVHRPGFARIYQGLGFLSGQGFAGQRLEPRVVFLRQQVVQKQRGLELVLLPVRSEIRQR
ncbi:hypothetical protein D9M68_755760 [compost metagenome]